MFQIYVILYISDLCDSLNDFSLRLHIYCDNHYTRYIFKSLGFYILYFQKYYISHRSRNLKEYHWTKLSSFLFGVLIFCRFWFNRFEKIVKMKKLNKTIFHNKTKLPNPIRQTRVSKLGFVTIPCLKFWALRSAWYQYNEDDILLTKL